MELREQKLQRDATVLKYFQFSQHPEHLPLLPRPSMLCWFHCMSLHMPIALHLFPLFHPETHLSHMLNYSLQKKYYIKLSITELNFKILNTKVTKTTAIRSVLMHSISRSETHGSHMLNLYLSMTRLK